MVSVFKISKKRYIDRNGFLKAPLRKSKNNFRVFVGDAHEIPLKDKSIDISICSETLEHVKDPVAVREEISRITKNIAIFSVPNEKNTKTIKEKLRKVPLSSLILKNLSKESTVPEHINFWNKNSFIEFLEEDFDIVDTSSVPKFPEIKIMVKCKVKN